MVELLENRAQHLVQGNYNGYTVESIEADIQDLLDQLATANATLRNITLDSSSVQPLQYILSEVRIYNTFAHALHVYILQNVPSFKMVLHVLYFRPKSTV